MNIIDVTNIKKELAKRNAANYDWEDGGEIYFCSSFLGNLIIFRFINF